MPAGPADAAPAAIRPITVDIGEIALTRWVTRREGGLLVTHELASRRNGTTTVAVADDLARPLPTDRAAFDPARAAPSGTVTTDGVQYRLGLTPATRRRITYGLRLERHIPAAELDRRHSARPPTIEPSPGAASAPDPSRDPSKADAVPASPCQQWATPAPQCPARAERPIPAHRTAWNPQVNPFGSSDSRRSTTRDSTFVLPSDWPDP